MPCLNMGNSIKRSLIIEDFARDRRDTENARRGPPLTSDVEREEFGIQERLNVERELELSDSMYCFYALLFVYLDMTHETRT